MVYHHGAYHIWVDTSGRWWPMMNQWLQALDLGKSNSSHSGMSTAYSTRIFCGLVESWERVSSHVGCSQVNTCQSHGSWHWERSFSLPVAFRGNMMTCHDLALPDSFERFTTADDLITKVKRTMKKATVHPKNKASNIHHADQVVNFSCGRRWSAF